MGVGVGLYMYDVVVKRFTFVISSADEFLLHQLWSFVTHEPFLHPFLQRAAMLVLATAIPSVCPSVRLSHAGIVSKRLHVAWCSLHRQIAKCV